MSGRPSWRARAAPAGNVGPSRRRRGRRGVATVEAALAFSLVLIPLCLSVIGIGMALATANRLDRAIQAGLFHAWANPGTPSAWGGPGSTLASQARAQAVTAYGPAAPAASISATPTFNCVTAGYIKVPPPVAYNAACAVGDTLATYLTLTATASISPPGFPGSVAIPLSVSATVRVQ